MQEILFKPVSMWETPKRLPSLGGIEIASLDIETCDPNLQVLGCGGIRHDGYIAGFSVYTNTGISIYVPICHLGGGNYHEPAEAWRWLKQICENPKILKVGTNLPYEMEWLECSQGIKLVGPLYDVCIAEALIDEEAYSVGLEACAQKYLGESKDESLLKYAADCYGINPKSEMYKLHAKYVGPYGEVDTKLPYKIMPLQKVEIEKQGLEKVLELELKVMKCVWKMRKCGVRIDLTHAKTINQDWTVKENILLSDINGLAGFKVNIWANNDLATACQKMGIMHPLSRTGLPSFKAEFLDVTDDPFLIKVRDARTINRLRGVFVEELISKFVVHDRIHPQIHQLKGDEYGVRGGRFSYSCPNLQQIPSKDDMAEFVRMMFIAEEGKQWGKFDYSQQEPRIMVHYAALMAYNGAADMLKRYKDDPSADFYNVIVNAAGISRRQSKDLSLGRSYGMGKKKMAEKLNTTIPHAIELLAKFDEAVPFIKQLSDSCNNMAKERGYIKTLLGRRRHFNMYEPRNAYYIRNSVPPRIVIPMPLNKAEQEWPGCLLQRANTHKAFNALIQGSGGDMNKRAMVDMDEQFGITPYLTMHDEFGVGIDGPETVKKIVDCMINAIELMIPMKVDVNIGRSWK